MFSSSTLHAARNLLRQYSTAPPYPGPAFAFDIDGVLLRGRSVIPAAHHALNSLYDQSNERWRAPITFITNGGGTTEAARAQKLTDMLNVPVHEQQIVLSHTPMKTLIDAYKHRAILTVGNPHCASVARSYGFQHVIDTETLAHIHTHSAPFAKVDHVQPSPGDYLVAKMPVAVVFVMTDSRDWGRDIQLLLDVLRSDGHPKRAHSDKQTVDLYFSNPDILFPNEYHMPRLAGGSFAVALRAVYRHVTGTDLQYVQFGKPHAPNYQLAESVLRNQLMYMGYCPESMPAIYAIGDNPPSDVRGANARGDPWRSVLVRTGNFQGQNDETDTAHVVFDNVAHAVQHALEQHDMYS
ncbi:putative CDP-alcohol phosphatidyltransferase class-I family protein [Gracilariopsis chorda]|uniref:Putative CDP-alcohol phosphatidyltransferase class-I family protein n=1 Tax=Gracilariopsis chorda TaxID=448386 RepID=A0A2V3IH68_9FLOR|nr:putative CDP-alcohol phosphatidyltransferase class-I family protein [Gracilariopsis chorda]|eukprot:PXF41402.1 putative CDP-alcohol phosphatidyltransferase class-I family protein [Gracilariopsis chorda]